MPSTNANTDMHECMQSSPHKTFHVINIGCKVNRVEADTMTASLISDGWIPADPSIADLIIVKTCTVTGEADKKCRKAIRRALASNNHARMLVTGCAAALDPEAFEMIDERVDVITRSDVARIIADKHESDQLVRVGDAFRTRVGIKVQDGCKNSCTYCIVRKARSVETSLPLNDALRQAERYFEAGVNEIILTGINIGAYADGTSTLSDLVRELLSCSKGFVRENGALPRIRVSSIEPLDVEDRLIELLAESDGSFCRHLHIPLQSGNTKVLSEMNRPYTAEWYLGFAESCAQPCRRFP